MIIIPKRQKPRKYTFNLAFDEKKKETEVSCEKLPEYKVSFKESIAEIGDSLLEHLRKQGKLYDIKMWYYYPKRNEAIVILK